MTKVTKAIQLTDRDKDAIWKSREGGMILMADMDEEYLQKALIIVQRRKVRTLDMMQLDFKLEQQLIAEAKKRDFNIQQIEELKDNPFAIRHAELKEFFVKLAAYFKRNVKKEEV